MRPRSASHGSSLPIASMRSVPRGLRGVSRRRTCRTGPRPPFRLTSRCPRPRKLASAPMIADAVGGSWQRAPLARAMPQRWIAVATARGSLVAFALGAQVDREPAVGPDPHDKNEPPADQPAIDEGMRWMVDFDEAERHGMALRLKMPSAIAQQGIDALVVFGVSAARTEAGIDCDRIVARCASLHERPRFPACRHADQQQRRCASGWSSQDPLHARSFEYECRAPDPPSGSNADVLGESTGLRCRRHARDPASALRRRTRRTDRCAADGDRAVACHMGLLPPESDRSPGQRPHARSDRVGTRAFHRARASFRSAAHAACRTAAVRRAAGHVAREHCERYSGCRRTLARDHACDTARPAVAAAHARRAADRAQRRSCVRSLGAAEERRDLAYVPPAPSAGSALSPASASVPRRRPGVLGLAGAAKRNGTRRAECIGLHVADAAGTGGVQRRRDAGQRAARTGGCAGGCGVARAELHRRVAGRSPASRERNGPAARDGGARDAAASAAAPLAAARVHGRGGTVCEPSAQRAGARITSARRRARQLQRGDYGHHVACPARAPESGDEQRRPREFLERPYAVRYARPQVAR